MRADHQGKKGELRFEELCHDAELNCNSSEDWDKTGWDFLVDFPLNWKSLGSLEKVATPVSCHVQVKTIVASKDEVQIPISAALRMVTEPKPYFVYVLKMSDDKTFKEAWLIHVIDDVLAKFLKKFRWLDQKRKRPKPGAKEPTITLPVSRMGVVLQVEGDALKNALAGAIGLDMPAYISHKEHLKNTLGYEERRYAGQFSLKAEDPGDLVDVFLGLKKDVPVADFSLAERRFGIESPVDGHPGPVDGLLSIEPPVFDTCVISFRNAAGDRDAVFSCSVYLPAVPKLPVRLFKVRYTSEGFELTQTRDTIQLTLSGAAGSRRLSQWIAYWRLLLLLQAGNITADIVCDTRSVRGTLSGKLLDEPPATKAECGFWISLCEQAQAVLSHVGSDSDPEMTLKALEEAKDQIRSAYMVIDQDQRTFSRKFTTEAAQLPSEPFEVDVVYAEVCAIGAVLVGFWGVMQVTGRSAKDKVVWKSGSFELKRIAALSKPQDYLNMIQAAKQETGLVGVISRNIEPDDLGQSD